MHNKYITAMIPIVIFIALVLLLLQGLKNDPQELPTELAGKPVPEFSLTELSTGMALSNTDLPKQPFLLNVWATWCTSCYVEHPFLVALADNKVIPIVGINHKDERQLALDYLNKYENPFVLNIFDPSGRLGIDLGVYGAPETFLIDGNNTILMRHVGVLDQRVWEAKFLPVLSSLSATNAESDEVGAIP